MSRCKTLVCLIIAIFCSLSLQAQFYRGSDLSFGRSRIQYDPFRWSFYRTHTADIYYYPQSQPLAICTGRQIDTLIRQAESRIHYQSQNKLQIIIFSKYNDYQQSNIGWEINESYYPGGWAPLNDQKILIYFDGDMRHFQTNLRSGIAQWLVIQMMQEQNRLGIKEHLPTWFKDGAGPYFADEWDEYIFAEVQDGFSTGRYKQVFQLPKSAQITAGNSFWRFIASMYGEGKVTPILQIAALTNNYEKAFQSVLLKTWDQLYPEWEAFYMARNGDSTQETGQTAGIHTEFHPDYEPLLEEKASTCYNHFTNSADGRHTAFSTNKEGQVCLFLLDRQNNLLQRLSSRHYRVEDFPDYSNPILLWHPLQPILTVIDEKNNKVYLRNYYPDKKKWGTEQIVFVDKITHAAYSDNGKQLAFTALQNSQTDLFLYNLHGKNLQRITDDAADEADPCFVQHDQVIVVSSNCNGNMDLYAYNLQDKHWEQWTSTPLLDERQTQETEGGNILYIANHPSGINQHCIGYIHTSTDNNGHYHHTLHSRPLFTHTSAVIRHHYHPLSHELLVSFIKNGYPVIYKTTLPPVESIPSTTAINIGTASDNSSNPIHKPLDNTNTLPVPRIHETEYGNISVTSNFNPDFFNIEYQQFTNSTHPIYLNSGINLALLVTAKDLMEDHRLSIGARVSLNLRNREFLFSYEDLSHRWDRQWTLYYQSIENKHSANDIIKLQSTSIFYKLGYPLDEAYTVHITPYLRYNQKHAMSLNDSSLLAPSQNSFWGGLKGDFVADFTKLIGYNTRKGFRGKFFAEVLLSPFSEFHYLNVIGADLRHYQVIRRNLIWANRVAASSSFGRDHLIYYMGGVDKWLNASFDAGNPIDSSFNYSYQTLATNMRGFPQNIRNGNSFFVWNTEIRFPFISYFFQRDLTNPFLNSLQLVSFADIGTAWHDTHLYHRILTANYQTDANRQGLIAGFGIGFRAYIISYFLRLDYAWGLSDHHFNRGVFYLSFNSDF